jgi:hypothetical protein
MASRRMFSPHADTSGEGVPTARELRNGRLLPTVLVLTVGLMLIVAALSYLDIQLGVSSDFRYANDLRITFLVICLASLGGAISGLTQLNKR